MALNEMFTDHMVLQGNKRVNIFGTGSGSVSVTVDNETKSARCENGEWVVTLDAHPYGGPYNVDIAMGEQTKRIKDVYFGDVYLIAGQSNMEWKMKNSNDTSDLTSELCRLNWKTSEKIRYFALGSMSGYEYFSPEDGWIVANKKTNIDYMSALGYNVALNIANEKDRAVGLVACYQGASIIESWLPEDICAKEEYAIPEAEKHPDHTDPRYTWNKNGILYNNVFKKAVGYTYSHAIWYQGESNTSAAEATIYDKLVKELIARWRSDLNDAALPFILVQIADYEWGDAVGWPGVQAAQAKIPEETENVKMVVSRDVCVDDDIHPKDKRALAKRIAALIE
ncbi:MAG: hypothetical protein IJ514_03825 [Clostridia bacterium]|nr:hypothetical protein [Clostridia bacterium]